MIHGKKTGQTSLVLNPDQLAEYAKVDRQLPALVVEARNAELRRQFVYAMSALVSGAALVIVVILAFVFLVLHGHAQAATALLGVGVLGLIGGLIRSRL